MENSTNPQKYGQRNLLLRIAKPAATAFFLTISGTSMAGVIALDSSLAVDTLAGYGVYQVTDTASVTQSGVTNTLGLLSASAVSTSPGGTLITSGSAIATWNNTASGQVSFNDIGWENSAFGGSSSSSSVNGTQWTYTFQADVTGLFSISWDVSLQQSLAQSFGLQDFRFSLAGTGGGQTVMRVDTTGSTTRNIIAGNQYTALIETNAGIVGGVGGRTSFMDGLFDWSMDSGPMSSVPEPASIALLGLGVLMLRGRRYK